MPRLPRQRSHTGIYHLIARRSNRTTLFHEDEDYYHYLRSLARISEESSATIMGYCLMTNHIHLLVQEDSISISKIMHRLEAMPIIITINMDIPVTFSKTALKVKPLKMIFI